MIVGLTGGIASGKSTVSNFFRALGVKIVDADLVAKQISEKEEIIKGIIEIFGADILDENREISRVKLREKAFKNKELLGKLNLLIHPRVIDYFEQSKKNTPEEEIVIFDVPLLYEAHMDRLCDKIIVVGVGKELQIERIMLRDGSSREIAEKIISSQMSLEDKMKRADIVIMNEAGLEELKERVISVYKKLKER